MQAILHTKNNDHFDIIGTNEVGIDLAEYTKAISIPVSELQADDPVSVAETFVQESHNIYAAPRWVMAGDVFCIGGDYYVYADVNDGFLVDQYKLLPAWPRLIIFKADRNVKV